MNNRQSRKKQLVKRIFVYSLMTLTMLGLLVLFTYKILGYQYNFTTRMVERTGLIQFDSFPRLATVQIDGKRIGTPTRTKYSVLPGSRQFSMSLAGYNDWQKTLDIKVGTVTWLDYVRLVPLEKTVDELDSVENLLAIGKSPDSRFMAGISRDSTGDNLLVMLDFKDSLQPKLAKYLMPVEAVTRATEGQSTEHSFSVKSWDNSSRRVLIRHDYKGDVSGSEWLWVDRERPSEIININKLTNLSITDVKHGRDGEVYTQQSNGDVRKLVVNTGTISRPLLSNVVSFDLYDSTTIYYTGVQGENTIVGIFRNNWNVPLVLDSVNRLDGQSLKISVSRYFNQDTVAISKGTAVLVYRGDLPTSIQQKDVFMEKTYGTLTLSRPLESLSLGRSGRFVIAEDAQGFVSYDIELKSISQQIKKYQDTQVRWLDDYHIWQTDETNAMVMQEFDGVNSHRLMNIANQYDALLTPDGRFIYAFDNSVDDPSAVILKRLHMTVD